MASNIIDPIQGLVDYVLEIKPYHTKIVEVLIEYVHVDCLDITITDILDIHVDSNNNLPIPLGVVVGEELHISTLIEFNDTIYSYNLENTDALGYDGIPVAAFFGVAAPVITETPMAPASPALDDFWFDTTDVNNGLLYRWNDVFWEIASPAYWYDQNTEQLFYRVWYISGGNTTDTGWLPVESPNAYGWFGVGYNAEPNSVAHGFGYVSVNVANNTFVISGGNFAHHLFNGVTFDGYDVSSQIGSWEIDDFSIISTTPSVIFAGSPVPNTGSFLVESDLTSILSPGVHFYVSNSLLNKGWFTITGLSLIGTNTEISVQEQVHDISLFGQIDPLSTGVVPGAFFNRLSSPNPTTILVPKNALVNAAVEIITYTTTGPLQIDIDVVPADIISPNITDTANAIVTSTFFTEDLNLVWGNAVDWFQFIIISVDVVADSFLVAGNATIDVQPGEELQVLGSVNAGEYIVSVVSPPVYDSINDTTTINITSNIPFDVNGGWIEPTGDLDIVLSFVDDIGTSLSENAQGAVLLTAEQIGSWDSNYWDVSGFDENLGTLINLYGG